MSVIVYSKNNCPECAKALALLDAKGVEYTAVKVEDTPGAREFLMARGHRSVPQIYVNGEDVAYVGDYKTLAKFTEHEFESLKKE